MNAIIRSIVKNLNWRSLKSIKQLLFIKKNMIMFMIHSLDISDAFYYYFYILIFLNTIHLISMMFSCLRLSRILISLRVLWIVKIISIIITITIKMHIMIVWTFSFKFKIWHLSSNRFWHQISRSQWLK